MNTMTPRSEKLAYTRARKRIRARVAKKKDETDTVGAVVTCVVISLLLIWACAIWLA